MNHSCSHRNWCKDQVNTFKSEIAKRIEQIENHDDKIHLYYDALRGVLSLVRHPEGSSEWVYLKDYSLEHRRRYGRWEKTPEQYIVSNLVDQLDKVLKDLPELAKAKRKSILPDSSTLR